MRFLLILSFLIFHLGAFSQYENKWRIKKSYKKFYSEKEKDTVSELISTEELDKNGILIAKTGYTPNENLPYTCTYHYRDTFLIKKVITRKKYIQYDTATYVDSVIREMPGGYNPFFKQSYSRDKSGNRLYVPRTLDEGHQLITTTHYETRDDSRLEFDHVTKKNKMKRNFYQLVHEYFIEYDSLGREVAEYSSIDKWEYDKVDFRKFEYDGEGHLSKIKHARENHLQKDEFDSEKYVLNLYSDSTPSEMELRKKNTEHYSEVIVYNLKGIKTQEYSFYLQDSSKLQSASIFFYDEKGRFSGEQRISGDKKSEKTYSYLNRNSLKVTEIKTRSQFNEEPVEFESEIFRYNSNNHLLIEQFKEKNGIKSNWFTYEYTFH